MSLQNPTPEENAACLALIGQTLMPPCGGESPASKERRQRLRDEFAMAALTGCFSFWVQVNARTVIGDPDPKAITKLAYEYADAMLAAREA